VNPLSIAGGISVPNPSATSGISGPVDFASNPFFSSPFAVGTGASASTQAGTPAGGSVLVPAIAAFALAVSLYALLKK